MSHLAEDELILAYYRESSTNEDVRRHLDACAECRGALDRLRADLGVWEPPEIPPRGPEYGREVWARVRPRLSPGESGPRHARPYWLAAAAAVVLGLTFLLGRLTAPPVERAATLDAELRDRVVLVALAEHLGRAQWLLVELSRSDVGPIERDAAEELLRASRLYRQSAEGVIDVSSMDALAELERLLLDVAHESSPAAALRSRIDEHGLLFKIRVLQTNLQRSETTSGRRF